MGNAYIFEGKTTNEAIEKGLKELKVSKNKVDIKVLETEEKRSFFSILTPRVVKVEIKLKEEKVDKQNDTKKEDNKDEKKVVKNVEKEEIDEAIENIKKFLDEFIEKLPSADDINYRVEEKNGIINIDIDGQDTGYLIGYRGEVLNSIQLVISNIASKSSKDKLRVSLNIGSYREKREKDLENLAVKIAKTVIKTRRSITLEPMSSYERKIIHTKLQNDNKVKTYSVGEEPHRKVVIAMK